MAHASKNKKDDSHGSPKQAMARQAKVAVTTRPVDEALAATRLV